MPTDQHSLNPFVWIVGFSILVILLLAFSSLLRSPARHREPLFNDRVGPTTVLPPVPTVPASRTIPQDPAQQVKPSSIDLSALSDTQSKPTAQFFHKLPPEFFTPQSLESTRIAVSVLQDLHAAHSGAGLVRKHPKPGDFANERAQP